MVYPEKFVICACALFCQFHSKFYVQILRNKKHATKLIVIKVTNISTSGLRVHFSESEYDAECGTYTLTDAKPGDRLQLKIDWTRSSFGPPAEECDDRFVTVHDGRWLRNHSRTGVLGQTKELPPTDQTRSLRLDPGNCQTKSWMQPVIQVWDQGIKT